MGPTVSPPPTHRGQEPPPNPPPHAPVSAGSAGPLQEEGNRQRKESERLEKLTDGNSLSGAMLSQPHSPGSLLYHGI